MALLFSACDSSSPPKRRPKPAAEEKSKADAAKKEIPIPKVVDIDPSTLDPKPRGYYDQGYAKGKKAAEGFWRSSSKDGQPPEDKLVQEELEQKDVNIQAALQKSGENADDPRVIQACGYKAGFKEGLAKHGSAAK